MKHVSWRTRLLAGYWLVLGRLALGCGRADDTTALDSHAAVADGSNDSSPRDSGTRDSGASVLVLPNGYRLQASGRPVPASECQTAAECPPSPRASNPPSPSAPAVCSEVVPGGYRICAYETPEATEPSGNGSGSPGECDGSRPCATGSCYRVVFLPSGVCGSGGATEQNRCRSDVCSSDADCPGGVCGPRGYSDENQIEGGFIRECIPAQCRADAECNAQPGGVCALIRQGCEPRDRPGYLYRPTQLACIYPDGCARDQDCPTGGHCIVTGGQAVCIAR